MPSVSATEKTKTLAIKLAGKVSASTGTYISQAKIIDLAMELLSKRPVDEIIKELGLQ